jgi:hypothetical protein
MLVLGETIQIQDVDDWVLLNIRVEVDDGVPDVVFWYTDPYTRGGVPVSEIPRLIEILQTIYDQYEKGDGQP